MDTACKTLGPGGVVGDAAGRVCYLRGDVWNPLIKERVLPLLRAAGGNTRDIMVR